MDLTPSMCAGVGRHSDGVGEKSFLYEISFLFAQTSRDGEEPVRLAVELL